MEKNLNFQPTNFDEKFTWVLRILVYTHAPIQAMVKSNWGSFEKKKNIKTIRDFFDITKYKFDKMDIQELINTMIYELKVFIEASMVTHQVRFLLLQNLTQF